MSKPADVRLLPVLLVALVMSGCAIQIDETRSIEMMPRDSNTVSRGIVSNAFPSISRIIIDIDRRTYMGTSERTAPNGTFGLALAYGHNSRAAGPARTPGGNHYYKAILSSADNHVLRCDLAGDEGSQRDGLCVDDFGRVYDVVSSR